MIIPNQLLPTFVTSVAAAASAPSVTVDAGNIIGGQCSKGNSVFDKSIPYDQPPVGDLRFEAPEAYSKVPNGQLNATSPATACIQFGETFEAQGKKSVDCWTPANATVSINYRLGPLGFMALESAGLHGNQGIQDLLLGLKWIKEGSSAFGGGADKMMLFGRSADATDVYIIATLADAPSLIKSVIAESIALPSLIGSSSVEGTAVSYAKELDCDVTDKNCFQSKSVGNLKSAFSATNYYDLSLFKDTPLPVIAAISTSGTDAEYKCTAYQRALQTARNGVPSWLYGFTHNSSCVWLDTMPQEFIEVLGAAHTTELPYAFGNLHFNFANKNTACAGTSDEWSLSKAMMGLWTTMAEKGSPSTNAVHWSQFRATANGSDVQEWSLETRARRAELTSRSYPGGAKQPTSSPTSSPTSHASGPAAAMGILLAGVAFAN
ncbi:hypothetical protein PWT90_02065 [Aphanocladium album]|nr:hypothetical protein PWT90_02065 [Aphanocladium album]